MVYSKDNDILFFFFSCDDNEIFDGFLFMVKCVVYYKEVSLKIPRSISSLVGESLARDVCIFLCLFLESRSWEVIGKKLIYYIPSWFALTCVTGIIERVTLSFTWLVNLYSPWEHVYGSILFVVFYVMEY